MMHLRRRSLMGPDRKVKYIPCEYIESNGTQVIKLNYVPKKNTRIDMMVAFGTSRGQYVKATSGVNTGSFFGVSDGTDNQFSANFGGATNQHAQTFNWVTSYQGPATGNKIFPMTNTSYPNKQRYILGNGLASWGSYKVTLPNKPYDNTREMCLFGFNATSGKCLPFVTHDMAIYEAFRIYEGDILVREYVPCYYIGKNGEDVPGLYDAITDTFCGNIGTGRFLYKAKS